HNGRAVATSGAARLIEQDRATPEIVVDSLLDLVTSETVRQTMQSALARWERPQAADEIAEAIVQSVSTVQSRIFDSAFGRRANVQSSRPGSPAGATAPLLEQPVTCNPRQEE